MYIIKYKAHKGIVLYCMYVSQFAFDAPLKGT